MGAERGCPAYGQVFLQTRRVARLQTEFSTCTFSLPVSGDFFVGSLETLAHLTYAFASCQVLVINSCICLAKVVSQPRVHRAVGTVRQPHKVVSGRPTSSCDFPLRPPKGAPVAL